MYEIVNDMKEGSCAAERGRSGYCSALVITT